MTDATIDEHNTDFVALASFAGLKVDEVRRILLGEEELVRTAALMRRLETAVTFDDFKTIAEDAPAGSKVGDIAYEMALETRLPQSLANRPPRETRWRCSWDRTPTWQELQAEAARMQELRELRRETAILKQEDIDVPEKLRQLKRISDERARRKEEARVALERATTAREVWRVGSHEPKRSELWLEALRKLATFFPKTKTKGDTHAEG
jgi:hypothetical protein